MGNIRTSYRTLWRNRKDGIGCNPSEPNQATAISYLLRDELVTSLAAGAVSGTSAEPGPGVRTVPFDVGGVISITGGKVAIPAGTNSWDQTVFGYTTGITRRPGVALFVQHRQALNRALNIGFWSTNSMGGAGNTLYMRNIDGQIDFSESIRGAAGTAIGTYAGATDYIISLVLKATGFMVIIRGGAFADWTVLHQGGTSTVTPMYAGYNVFSSGAGVTSDYLRIARLPSPFDTDASMDVLSGQLTGAAKAALDNICPP